MSQIKQLPLEDDIETKVVLKNLILAHQALAELKGVAASMPNQSILISKHKLGKGNFYLNDRLFTWLANVNTGSGEV